jgi:hypothetical protein
MLAPMDGAIWGFVGVVVGGLITGLVSIRLETIRSDKASALDGARRHDDRRLALDQFQRETLLALQEAVGDVNAHMIRHRLRFEGVIPEPETSETYRVATGKVIMLRSRVMDEQVRQSAADFIQAVGEMTGTRDATSAEAGLGIAAGHARKVIERSGELIRTTFMAPAKS